MYAGRPAGGRMFVSRPLVLGSRTAMIVLPGRARHRAPPPRLANQPSNGAQHSSAQALSSLERTKGENGPLLGGLRSASIGTPGYGLFGLLDAATGAGSPIGVGGNGGG